MIREFKKCTKICYFEIADLMEHVYGTQFFRSRASVTNCKNSILKLSLINKIKCKNKTRSTLKVYIKNIKVIIRNTKNLVDIYY